MLRSCSMGWARSTVFRWRHRRRLRETPRQRDEVRMPLSKGRTTALQGTDASTALRNETLHRRHTRYGAASMEQHAARRNLLRDLAASPLISAPSIASGIAALIASAPNEASAQSYDA